MLSSRKPPCLSSGSLEALEDGASGDAMQRLFANAGVHLAAEEQLSHRPKPVEPAPIACVELFLELFADPLRQRGTLARGRNGNLQVASPHHRGIEEVAALRIVHRVAEHAALPRCLKDLLVDRGITRCGDRQKCTVQMRRPKLRLNPAYAAAARQLLDRLGCVR